MIALSTFDYALIIAFFATTLIIGLWVSKKSGKSSSEYFLSGRTMPWWLLGMSMVATTFSTDTPNLVTDIVRQNGVAGNWAWWAFLVTGLLTVFVYAKLWRKSAVNTDMEFYELRYGGKPARFLRGFRSVYLGVIFNIFAMSAVSLAAIKIGNIMLGLEGWETLLYAGLITVIFSAMGGFKGVIYTDFLLFFVAMLGAIGAAYYLVNVPEVGGIKAMMANEAVASKLSILPDIEQTELFITLLIIPLAVQWWSTWYPGAEPGGGGYIAQRMLAAKDENHAIGATFFFNIMHYALRPWPWILVALASLVAYPTIESIASAFPNVAPDKLGHDLAYSAMLTKLPSGLLGLVLTSLVAAYMSTISTHLNWGSSYVVNDFYRQIVKPDASEKELVSVGRVATVILMVVSALVALQLNNAKQLFDFILMFGAGTGLIFILRWFWWRINAWTEIVAMFASGLVSLLFHYGVLDVADFGLPAYWKIPMVVILVSAIWLIVMFLTPAESNEVLYAFYKKTQPGGLGWRRILAQAKAAGKEIEENKGTWSVPAGILAMLLGLAVIYSAMFTTGNIIYGRYDTAAYLSIVLVVAVYFLLRIWKKIKADIL